MSLNTRPIWSLPSPISSHLRELCTLRHSSLIVDEEFFREEFVGDDARELTLLGSFSDHSDNFHLLD